MLTFKGTYKRNIFISDKGYIIGSVKVNKTDDEELKSFVNKMVTFTGYFHELKLDDSYIFKGELVEHPKYGLQFNTLEYDIIKPEDEDGLIEFLSSNLFKGIGSKLAKKIVDTLGIDAIDKILKEKETLLLVPTMTLKKADKIYDTLIKYEESHKTIVYLIDLGFSLKDALIVYNTYKGQTINIVENNIYKLVDDIEEINFKKIDDISLKLGVKEDDENRLKACIIYTFKEQLFKTGDTYLYLEEIKEVLRKYLNFYIEDEIIGKLVEELILIEKIKQDSDRYYITANKESEDEIISKIRYLLNKKPTKINRLDDYIEKLEFINKITYNDDQKLAIKKALENNITIITGGPGVGKTTIIKAICDLYIDINFNKSKDPISDIALLAPTGRASKRMSEATLLKASTIHRFLKWNKETNKFAINEYNKDESKYIIIDEVSMIDLDLLASLFKGLMSDIKIVLVGDYNQLPSVGIGQILKDLIDSEEIDTIKLNTLYRQSDDSYIPVLAYEIRSNILPNYLTKKDDYVFLECQSSSILNSIKDLSIKLVEKNYNYKQVQIMAPMYAGINGIDNLNKVLQNIFNPPSKEKAEIKVGDITYRENDKILQLVNIPELNVYNGDIGVIEKIVLADVSESKKNEIYINFDNEIVKYLPKDFIKIKHGFVISIHKSQGSEFDIVIMPICSSYYRMLYKKLLYTGITRAKKKLILIGESNAFKYAISNNYENYRKTYLKERLQKMYNVKN